METIHLNRKPFHLVGTSMGGNVAGVYASCYPSEICSMTLICPDGEWVCVCVCSKFDWNSLSSMELKKITDYLKSSSDENHILNSLPCQCFLCPKNYIVTKLSSHPHGWRVLVCFRTAPLTVSEGGVKQPERIVSWYKNRCCGSGCGCEGATGCCRSKNVAVEAKI